MDAVQLHLLSKEGFYIEPDYVREHKQRMAQITAEYEYNMTAKIPTWMSDKLAKSLFGYDEEIGI